MMCDTNWCTYCDVAISPYSDALYCSQDCLQRDAIHHHVIQPNDYQHAVMARYNESRSPSVIVSAARTRVPRSISSKEDLGSSCSASTFSSSGTAGTPQ
ncbi:hypothetical protein BCR43DRAFT_498658 [Syncephalastrum racemosum]|uniref:Uncharacterized protein n=1 Tax=Syncephalastrum racemosum TaxID=13706 RepID=A0A1X2H179_SYNRA|nr:hypothetical protein BCR43DRAFT_498658 [Syncephalastrum racemosum]